MRETVLFGGHKLDRPTNANHSNFNAPTVWDKSNHMERNVGRIAVSKNTERYFSDPSYRAAVNDCLDYVVAPRGLSSDDLRTWLNRAVEAHHLRNDFGSLMQKLYKEVWLTGIKQHIRPSLSPSVCRYLDSVAGSAVSEKLIDDIWETHTHGQQISLPVLRLRKSTFPNLRTSILIDQEGSIVLTFEVIRPFQIKRLRPSGWRYSETSGHEYISGIRLAHTRDLELEPLRQAASVALKVVAEAYVPEQAKHALEASG